MAMLNKKLNILVLNKLLGFTFKLIKFYNQKTFKSKKFKLNTIFVVSTPC